AWHNNEPGFGPLLPTDDVEKLLKQIVEGNPFSLPPETEPQQSRDPPPAALTQPEEQPIMPETPVTTGVATVQPAGPPRPAHPRHPRHPPPGAPAQPGAQPIRPDPPVGEDVATVRPVRPRRHGGALPSCAPGFDSSATGRAISPGGSAAAGTWRITAIRSARR